MLSENYKSNLKKLAGIVTCKNCYHSWEKEKGDKDVYFCHVCGYDNEKNIFRTEDLKDWMKEKYGKLHMKENVGPGPNDVRPVSDIYMDLYNKKFQGEESGFEYNPDDDDFLDNEKNKIKSQDSIDDENMKSIDKKYKKVRRKRAWKNK
jgi:hypothetical protein